MQSSFARRQHWGLRRLLCRWWAAELGAQACVSSFIMWASSPPSGRNYYVSLSLGCLVHKCLLSTSNVPGIVLGSNASAVSETNFLDPWRTVGLAKTQLFVWPIDDKMREKEKGEGRYALSQLCWNCFIRFSRHHSFVMGIVKKDIWFRLGSSGFKKLPV